MAADSTSLKSQIDAALSGKGYRGVSVSAIVTTLKTVADWVRDSINANLSTWLKVSDGQPGGANTDTIYRMGKVIVGRTTDDGSGAALQVEGVTRLDRLYLDGKLTRSSSNFPALYSINTDGSNPDTISEPGAALLAVGANMSSGGSDVSFVNANTAGSGFSFSQMLSASTRRFLFYITGTGLVGIGTKSPGEALHVTGTIQADGYVRAGSGNKAFKITGVKSASGLTLKTGRYLELTLDDGTIVKVAEVN